MLIAALDKRVVDDEGGRRRRKSKRDLGLAQLADKFAQGDPHAAKLMLGVLLETERPPLEEADRLVIENLLARLRAP